MKFCCTFMQTDRIYSVAYIEQGWWAYIGFCNDVQIYFNKCR